MHKKIHLYYSVLQYMPDPIRRESMNVGIVFHIPSQNLSLFKHIKNRSRMRTFDDEYDSDYISMVFDSLKFEFNSDELDEYGSRFDNIASNNFLFETTKFYVNEFRFLPVEVIQTDVDGVEYDMHILENTYLYYDKPKGQRISTKDVQTIMKRNLHFYNFDLKINKRMIKSDFVGNNIFDFANNQYAFKAISFDKFRTKDLANELKVFYYDLNARKSEISHLKIFLVVNNEVEDLDEHHQINNIFNQFRNLLNDNFSNVHVVTLSKLVEKIN